MAGGKEDRQDRVMRRCLALLQALSSGASPPQIAHRLHRIARDIGAPARAAVVYQSRNGA